MTDKDVATDLRIEQDSHDRLYSNLRQRLKGCSLNWEEFYKRHCTPPHEGGQLYGLDIRIYLDRLDSVFKKLPVDSRILDYGCGMGEMSIAIATRGFDVTGFDLSGVGVETARALAEQASVSRSARFCVANAQALPFADSTFDLVLGKAVLHHTVKYPGTNTELYRVMKPGSQALFLEGAASNPLIRLARLFTIRRELGDVPLTYRNVRSWAEQFPRVDITGYFLLYITSVPTFC